MLTLRCRGAILGFAMVLATLLVNGLLSYLNVRRLHHNQSAVEHTHDILLALESLLSTVVDAETGQRGYLITGESNYLQPYQAAVTAIDTRLASVEQLTADDAAQRQNLAQLRRQIARRLEIIELSLEARKEHGFEAAKSIVLTGEGKAAMDAVREIVARMQRDEQRRLSARNADSKISYFTAIVAGLITTVLGICLAGAAFMLVRRDIDRRTGVETELTQINQRLEDRVRERTVAIGDANTALREEIEVRRQAQEQAQRFAEELQRSNRELEQFAAVASHDLQEPLRKIQAFGDRLQTLCREQLAEKGQDYLDRMLASASRMRKLIDDLLTYSRVTTKQRAFAPVDLAEVAREVVGDLEARIQQTGARVEIGELPTISADPLQMRQLLQNLIANALKFQRPAVPPVVLVSSRLLQEDSVATEDSQSALQCELTVSDNGIGFEQQYVDRIFELFQRLHGRDEYEGTGMGLAICRKIAERHRGAISAVSAPGEGARFVIVLPVEQPQPGEDA